MALPLDTSKEPSDFDNPEYWDNRYSQTTEMYDWYFEWDTLYPYLTNNGITFSGDERVINLGCGNSTSSFQMVESVFKSVVNIDISVVVIFQMQQKYAGDDRLIWETMDCCDLKYDDDSFDVIFDKGTMDALVCSNDSFNKVKQMFSECERVLTNGGLMISITYALPDLRAKYWKIIGDHWKPIEVFPISVPMRQREGMMNAFMYCFKLQK